MRRRRTMAYRIAVLLTVCTMGWGTAVPAVADVSVTQPDQDSSSHATVLGYGNLLCRLFPKLDGCRKQ